MNTSLETETFKSRFSAATWIVIALALAAPSAISAASVREFCTDATPLLLNSAQYVYPSDRGGADLFRLDVVSSGVLILQVSDLAASSSTASLDLVGEGCGGVPGEHMTFLEHSRARQVIRVDEPGSLFLRARTSPGGPRATYRVSAGFTEGLAIHPASVVLEKIEEWDEDDITQNLLAPAADEFMSVVIDRPGVLEIDAAGSGLLGLTQSAGPTRDSAAARVFTLSRRVLARVESGEHHVRWDGVGGSLADGAPPGVRFFPVCGLVEPDDHGDSQACASAIELGSRAVAEVSKASVTDLDYFSFTLDRHQTVLIETGGATDTYGRLLDATGEILAADDDSGAGVNFRIVEALCPGRYFVRVEGVGSSEGRYVLATGVGAAPGKVGILELAGALGLLIPKTIR